MSRRSCRGRLFMTGAAGLLLVGPFVVIHLANPAVHAAEPAPGQQPVEPSTSPAVLELSRAFRRAAEVVQPAVVSISTSQTRVIRLPLEGGESELEGRVLEWFRRRGLEPDDETGEVQIPDNSGIGSGMIVDAAGGLILTNHHVVEGADEIAVRLYDGRAFPAELINADHASDMALLRIEADRLREVALGDSQEVQVGDFVLAFGSPLGFTQTITHGIVSAVGRSGTTIPVHYQNFIQTDAAINQGNSGGPLVNLRGEVIGMNTAIATRTGFDAGIGFAIPASRIQALLPRLKSGEKIVRGYLGVVMQDVHLVRDRAIALGWQEDRGVIVDRVQADAPAGKAGVRPGDIIVEIDGKPVSTAADLQDRVAASEPGTTILVGVLREQKRKSLSVTVDRQPDDFLDLARRGLRAPRQDEAGEEADEAENKAVPQP